MSDTFVSTIQFTSCNERKHTLWRSSICDLAPTICRGHFLDLSRIVAQTFADALVVCLPYLAMEHTPSSEKVHMSAVWRWPVAADVSSRLCHYRVQRCQTRSTLPIHGSTTSPQNWSICTLQTLASCQAWEVAATNHLTYTVYWMNIIAQKIMLCKNRW